ncbi:MAG: Gfo/Idh/MocA family oxidoreductase [Clostridiales Family XIII bacterium]|jgi:predicted dehydrogenase|nr:Gfo/Idh/MocA family oxidoreductase [Clostridiales Family XIII bacterium]
MIRLGILGSGAVLQWHMHGVDGNENVTIKAIASRNEATGKAACERYGAAYYKTPEALLGNEKGLDGIVNLMPNHLHFETCSAAIDAGFRFILCEKPIGNDISQTIKLVEKAEAADTQLQVAYMKRFNPGFRKVKDALDVLGEIHFVNFTTIESGAANQVSHRDASSPWKTDPVLSGGGNLTHVGSHDIDLLRFLFGGIKTVSCRLKRGMPEYYVNASVLFENGVNANLRIGQTDIPDLGPDWMPFKGGWNEYLEVIGENGYIRAANPSWEGLGPVRVISWFKWEPGPKTEYFSSDLQWVNEVASFAKGIEEGKLVPGVTLARDAYNVDFAVRKMRESNEQNGAFVEI